MKMKDSPFFSEEIANKTRTDCFASSAEAVTGHACSLIESVLKAATLRKGGRGELTHRDGLI